MSAAKTKVLRMKLVRDDELSGVLCDLYVLEDLLRSITDPEDPANAASGIVYFLAETVRKLDKLTAAGYDVRWRV